METYPIERDPKAGMIKEGKDTSSRDGSGSEEENDETKRRKERNKKDLAAMTRSCAGYYDNSHVCRIAALACNLLQESST